AEIRFHSIARPDRQRRVAGPCRDHLSCPQREAETAQFVGEPGERDAGIAEYVLAVTDIALAAQHGHRTLLDEVARAPVCRSGFAEDEEMRAGIVGDELRFAG